MLYGIVYVYRLCDFIAIARGHGVDRIFLNSFWLKQSVSQEASQWTNWMDVHELGFMGAFGMGYKMMVEGLTQTGEVPDNHLLWTQSGLIETHVKAESYRGKTKEKQLIVTLGVLDSGEPSQYVRIPWTLFMENRIPTEAVVHEATCEKPERS
jgi:hypothetical protein